MNLQCALFVSELIFKQGVQGLEHFFRLRKFCGQSHKFYVRKFRNTKASVQANISNQIGENVKPKNLQAEDTYSH